MTSLTGPDLLASWLRRSISDPGVPGSIPGRGTRREYFLYRSISPPTTKWEQLGLHTPDIYTLLGYDDHEETGN